MQPIQIQGYEGQQIAVQIATINGAHKLFVNGQPAQPAPQKGRFVMYRNDGVPELAFFKSSFPDPVPSLMVGPQTVRLAPPLSSFQMVWIAIPMILLLSGCLGGVIGVAATALNAHIMRSQILPVIKYILCGLISFSLLGLRIALAVIYEK